MMMLQGRIFSSSIVILHSKYSIKLTFGKAEFLDFSSIVFLHSKFSIKLTFEKFLPGSALTQTKARWWRKRGGGGGGGGGGGDGGDAVAYPSYRVRLSFLC